MASLDAIPKDLWVFAYGSLLWNPGFPFVESQPARVRGYHRSLCVMSHVHRGTPDCPGLVLGLDRGGACLGLAYRVDAGDQAEALAYLRAREQVSAVYRESRLAADLRDGRVVKAIAYVVDRDHPQYLGKAALDAVLAYVRRGVGRSGANIDYVLSSHASLRQMGIRDKMLDEIAAALTGEDLNLRS